MQTINYIITGEEKHITLFSYRTMRFVSQHEILYLQSDNCYTKIYLVDNSSYLMCKTLKNYESELNREVFFRCHKSFLVNRFFIKEINRNEIDYLILTTGTRIPISRRKMLEFKRIMLSVVVE